MRGRVGHEEENPGCKKSGNCGKKTQGREGKELVGYITVRLWRMETVLLAKLQGKGIKLGKISTVKVKM